MASNLIAMASTLLAMGNTFDLYLSFLVFCPFSLLAWTTCSSSFAHTPSTRCDRPPTIADLLGQGGLSCDHRSCGHHLLLFNVLPTGYTGHSQASEKEVTHEVHQQTPEVVPLVTLILEPVDWISCKIAPHSNIQYSSLHPYFCLCKRIVNMKLLTRTFPKTSSQRFYAMRPSMSSNKP